MHNGSHGFVPIINSSMDIKAVFTCQLNDQ
jgi:hypothetical protein